MYDVLRVLAAIDFIILISPGGRKFFFERMPEVLAEMMNDYNEWRERRKKKRKQL